MLQGSDTDCTKGQICIVLFSTCYLLWVVSLKTWNWEKGVFGYSEGVWEHGALI